MMRTALVLGRRFAAVGQRRRASQGVAMSSPHSPTAAISAAAVAVAAATTTTASGRRRVSRPKNYQPNPLLDKLDLAADNDDDDESCENDDDGGGEGLEGAENAASSSPSTGFSSTSSTPHHLRQQRPLRGSLFATQTLRAIRRLPREIAASPKRFPLTGTFEFDGAKNDKGVDSSSPCSPSTFSLSSTQVIRAVSPFLSDDRVERIRRVASSRCFSVLPIVEGLFDRGNLGAVCRTAEAMGVGAVWAADLSSDRFRASRGRCSAGSERWIDIQVFSSPSDASPSPEGSGARRREEPGPESGTEPEPDASGGTLACLSAARAAGFRVVVAAAGPGAVPADEFDWEASPTAFVVGNEARGVSEVARKNCDGLVMIPMVGMVESLNVSVASACLMQAALGRIKREGRGGGRESLLGEEEAEALTAAMLLRHKGQQGKVGAQWQAPMFRELVARVGAGEAL